MGSFSTCKKKGKAWKILPHACRASSLWTDIAKRASRSFIIQAAPPVCLSSVYLTSQTANLSGLPLCIIIHVLQTGGGGRPERGLYLPLHYHQPKPLTNILRGAYTCNAVTIMRFILNAIGGWGTNPERRENILRTQPLHTCFRSSALSTRRNMMLKSCMQSA